MPERQPAIWPSELSELEVSEDDAVWHLVTGAASYEETGGDRLIREVETAGGPDFVVGEVSIPLIRINVGIYVPYQEAFRILRAALQSKASLHFRMRSASDERVYLPVSDSTVSIAASGALSFSAGGPDLSDFFYPLGIILRHGTAKGSLDTNRRVTTFGDMPSTRDAPESAISGHYYELVVPQIERPSFQAEVINVDRAAWANRSNLVSPLIIRPFTILLPEIRPVKGTSVWITENEEEEA